MVVFSVVFSPAFPRFRSLSDRRGERITMRRLSLLHIIRPILAQSHLALVFLVVAPAASSQATSEQTTYRTRAFLDSVATSLERTGKTAEAAAVRERLRVGDFYPGDRIVVELFGAEEPFRDTVPVRTGQEIVIQAFPAFSLKGVLRSEADSALGAQARRYIQRPVVRTQPLVRLLVTGAVGRPGFVTIRGDAAVSDVVSAAGGLTNMSRLPKSNMRRGTEAFIDPDSLAVIFRSGMTLDQADIRAGDELAIKEKKTSNWTGLIFAFSGILGVVFSLVRLAN
jgi:protein involved in polysaccharide export with SLBB domain